VAKIRHYKKIEKNVVSSVLSTSGRWFSTLGRGFSKFFHICDSKLTIMIVPHSQGKVLNFQTNVFALVFGIVLVVGIASSSVYFNKKAAGSGTEISRLMNENRQTLASLDELRDENNNLLQTAKRFQSSLSQSLSLLGINQTTTVAKASMNDSDLSSLFDTRDQVTGSTKEASDIRELNSYLESAVQPIEQIGKMLESQETLFTDIPNIWPIKGGIGHISMPFGQNIHPITGQWYIHKGLDFSTWRSGDPVIATANGQVVTVGFDASFGNYIIIKHKHGIYTRYCHLSTIRVKKGQFVSQRDIIGTIGNTGVTTGPHLHYEIHIGSDVVDPAKYVNVKLTSK
jgi:murein DD-endopeptidase MepM/ murein hydrolase activator NlpD